MKKSVLIEEMLRKSYKIRKKELIINQYHKAESVITK